MRCLIDTVPDLLNTSLRITSFTTVNLIMRGQEDDEQLISPFTYPGYKLLFNERREPETVRNPVNE